MQSAEAAMAESDAPKIPLMPDFDRRFDPSAIELRRAIDAEDVGEVRQIIITSR
jgi:myo-inositol 2-dehydrogenase/D-chiro-inositol 1-dehydrogenase